MSRTRSSHVSSGTRSLCSSFHLPEMAGHGSDPPSTKRARLDDEASSSSSITRRERFEDLWISDGNVILTTSAPGRLFRVHKGVLSRHSTVFRDMFDMPQGKDATGSETYEGNPVVYMSDDDEDLAHFLQALYDRLSDLVIASHISYILTFHFVTGTTERTNVPISTSSRLYYD